MEDFEAFVQEYDISESNRCHEVTALPSPTNTPPSLSAVSFACSNDFDGEDGLVYVGEGRDRAWSMCRPCTI